MFAITTDEAGPSMVYCCDDCGAFFHNLDQANVIWVENPETPFCQILCKGKCTRETEAIYKKVGWQVNSWGFAGMIEAWLQTAQFNGHNRKQAERSLSLLREV